MATCPGTHKWPRFESQCALGWALTSPGSQGPSMSNEDIHILSGVRLNELGPLEAREMMGRAEGCSSGFVAGPEAA